jgi:hypothetical protein
MECIDRSRTYQKPVWNAIIHILLRPLSTDLSGQKTRASFKPKIWKERARSNERCHTSIPPNLLSMTLESDPNFKPLLAYLSCILCYFTGLDPRQATQLMCSVGAPRCGLAHQPLHSGLRAVLCVEHVLGMSSSCRELFEEMVRCLSDSECVRSHPDPTRALSDCARRDAAGVPDTCRGTIEAYATCRRAQIDPARRIMGNPAARVKHE